MLVLLVVVVVVVVVIAVLAVLPMPVVALRDGLDLGSGAFNQDGMAADVLALHLLGCAEVVVGVGKTDEAIAFAFGGTLVSDDACLGYGGVFGEGLEERVVRNLAGQIADE